MPHKPDKKTVLLVGTGRGGTTWLATLLARPFRYRLLFEPFQPHQVPGAEVVADKYFSASSVPKPVESFVTRAIDDRIDSDWIAQSSNRRYRMHRWRFWPRARIVKSVRTNLLVPAYKALYGDNLGIVALVRHPGEVIESFSRVRFPWSLELDSLLEQRDLARDFGVPLDELRQHTDTDVGRYAVRWAIENGYLLKHHVELGVRLVRYEELLADPVNRICGLCADLGLEPAPDLGAQVERPSYTSHKRGRVALEGSEDPLWRQRLSTADQDKLEEVLRICGIRYD